MLRRRTNNRIYNILSRIQNLNTTEYIFSDSELTFGEIRIQNVPRHLRNIRYTEIYPHILDLYNHTQTNTFRPNNTENEHYNTDEEEEEDEDEDEDDEEEIHANMDMDMEENEVNYNNSIYTSLLNMLLNYSSSDYDIDIETATRYSMDDCQMHKDEDIVLNVESEKYIKNIHTQFDNCSICQESFVDETSMITILSCKHYFHTDCVNEWGKYKSECPICKSVIPIKNT